MTLGAFVLYAADSLVRHARFHTGFDLTIFDQAVDRYAHHQVPDVLVKSQQPFNILGDHFHPILVLLAPFYRLWPDARMLLIAQALLMAWGVHVITRLAVRQLGSRGRLLGAAFAVSWGILQAVDFDFHEIAFAVPLLALALEALLADRLTAVAVCSGLLVLVKEDSPLLVLGIALVLAARRRYRPALLLGAFAVVSFGLIVFVVIPHLSYSHTYTYFAYAGTGSTGTGLSGLVRSAVGTVFSTRGLVFLGALALTAGLGLRSPVLLALLPTLGARLVSNNYAYTGFLYHYNATLMVICFVALADGIARQRLRTNRSDRSADGRRRLLPFSRLLRSPGLLRSSGLLRSPGLLRAQGVLLGLVVAVSLARAPTVATIGSVALSCQRCADAAAAVAAIPDGTRVAADVFLMPQLVDRAEVMQAAPGFRDPSGLPITAQRVVLDLDSTSYTPGWSRTLLVSLLSSGRYRELQRYGRFVVLAHR